jgi:hypothetical protein
VEERADGCDGDEEAAMPPSNRSVNDDQRCRATVEWDETSARAAPWPGGDSNATALTALDTS